MLQWLGRMAVFVVTLVVLRFFFGLPISIGGSVVLTVVLSTVFTLFSRRRPAS